MHFIITFMVYGAAHHKIVYANPPCRDLENRTLHDMDIFRFVMETPSK